MSEAANALATQAEGLPPGEVDEEDGGASIEERARRYGWKDKDEFASGPPEKWKSAEDFVRDTEEQVPLLRAANRGLERRLAQMERRLGEATSTVAEMVNMTRSAEKRAFEKARAELLAERERAVENADTDQFRRIEQKLAEVEKEAPRDPKPAGGGNDPHPDALEWASKNPWFNSDEGMRTRAIAVYEHTSKSKPWLTVRENLAEVSAEMRRLYPSKFRDDGDDNERRRDPPAVSGASSAPLRRRSSQRGFDDLPADAKKAFEKQARMLKGKGEPFTREEYARLYWAEEE